MTEDSERIGLVQNYFARVDAGRQDVLELFHDQVEFYFPKFGLGKGKESLVTMWTGLGGAIALIVHEPEKFKYLISGNTVIVEGTTIGRYRSGAEWSGGTTPGGRFCNLFEFEGSLIRRLRVYLDPDYTSEDTDRFLWGRDDRAW